MKNSARIRRIKQRIFDHRLRTEAEKKKRKEKEDLLERWKSLSRQDKRHYI